MSDINTVSGEDLKRVRKILTDQGYFESGPYESLYLVWVLEAMNKSAWDYPSAMAAIGDVLGIKEWGDITNWGMRPDTLTLYRHLQDLCPDVSIVDWMELPSIWDT